MAITAVRHTYDEPGSPPSELHIAFDRQLSEREASELAQIVAGLHERHEAARDFTANDPHHRRHLSRRYLATVTTDEPDLDEDGAPITLGGVEQRTRTFTGTCGDCGRSYVRGTDDPPHYVCPSLPAESTVGLTFRVAACHEGCAIDCGRDVHGNPTRAVEE